MIEQLSQADAIGRLRLLIILRRILVNVSALIGAFSK